MKNKIVLPKIATYVSLYSLVTYFVNGPSSTVTQRVLVFASCSLVHHIVVMIVLIILVINNGKKPTPNQVNNSASYCGIKGRRGKV